MLSFIKKLFIQKDYTFDNVEWLIEDWERKERAFIEDLMEKSIPVIDLHYNLMRNWKETKKKSQKNNRHFKSYLHLLQADCIIHDAFVVEYYRKWNEEVSYPAFKELALAYERNGEYRKAIYISKLAIKKNIIEHTSFKNRIKRLKRKLSKE